ncbi:NACHT domain-containing protein [Lentzea sp. NPDC003310]|uniref:NACHT domain-containing protein n=1 Tax=Lentzea sp. NPDC003310 TaxID=3154447 RepID=UPI00339EE85F
MRWRPAPTTVLVLSVLATVLVGLTANIATGTVPDLRSWQVAAIWIAVGVLTAFLVLVEVYRARRGAPAGSLSEAAEYLAAAVRREWAGEAVRRGVFDPAPLPVRFHATRRAKISDHPAAVFGDESLRALPPATRPRLTGDVTGVLAAFRSIPARRLVVLGEAGAGKSVLAMLLTKALVEDRRADEPVPVLLPLASWDPGEHLHTWLERHLAEDHPGLVESFGRDVVAKLVQEQKVLPVLDGLDELEGAVRADALRKINHALADSRAQVVITCRATEFERAVSSREHVVSRAVVVELEPVPREEALAFLGDDAERWRPVADEIAARAEGPLARALGTPLMIGLARTVYRSADPRELATAADPEADLLERFIAAAYRTDIPTAGAAKRRWSPASAQRWLTFLAMDVARNGARDLAWWRLRDRVPRPARIAIVALFCTALLLPVFRWDLVAAVAVVCGLGAGLPRHSPEPQRLRLEFGRGRRRVEFVLVGLGLGVVAGQVTRSLAGVLVGAVVGVVAGVLAGAARYRQPEGAVTPWTVLRADRASSLRTGAALAAATAFTLWTVAPDRPVLGAVSAAVVFFLRWLALLTAVVHVLGLQVAHQLWLGFGTEVAVAVVTGIAVGAAVLVRLGAARPTSLAMTAWAQWVLLTRLWYPLTGRLPWALSAFLADAHRRGVLLQAGSRYRFRHLALLDHLAASREHA